MADKELRKMKRTELIEIIYALQQNLETLQQKNDELQKALSDRVVKIAEAGSIAEAVTALNDIFQKAQDTADQYIESVSFAQAHAKEDAERILSDANQKADDIVREAEERKKTIEEETDRLVNEKWSIFDKRVNDILSAHSELKELLDVTNDEGKEC